MKTSSKKNRKPAILHVRKIAYILLVTVILFVIFSLTSCKSHQLAEPVSHTEYVDRLRYDSIYLEKHDSIYIRQRGDTVTIEKFKTVFKDRLKIQKDTVVRTDTFTTAPVKITKIEKVKVYGFFWLVGFLFVLYIVFYLIIKVINFKLIK